MQSNVRSVIVGIASLALILVSSGALPASAPSVHTFVDTSDGIQINYPADWKSAKCKTAVLEVTPPPPNGPGCPSLCLDVPHLPWHLSYMISEAMVENGYVKDLQKNQIHDLHKDESTEIKVADGNGRLVRCSGHTGSTPTVDVAVICLHANKVYILSCDSDTDSYPVARAALDSAVLSLKWIN